MNPIKAITRLPEGLLRLWIIIALAVGLCACDRDDLTSGPFLENDEGTGPEPCEGDDCGPPGLPEDAELKINELMVENNVTLPDEDGNFVPWIELYNPTELELNLAGVRLSNSFLDPNKWEIPDIPEAVVGPFGYLIIFLDEDEEPDNLHANFTLTRGATTLSLNGALLDLVTVNTSQLPADEVMGRFPDGERGPFQLLEEPTPGEPNAMPSEGPPPPPQEAEFVRGDVTEDDRVTVSDMVGIQLILAGEQPLPDCEDRADANDDGVIDDLDAVAVGNAVFKGASLPPPYPSAGVDPTPDDLTCVVQ